MKIRIFCHSLISDWNHGNAHFLRGITSELLARRHEVQVYEPISGWSLRNLVSYQGAGAVRAFHEAFPELRSIRYEPGQLDLEAVVGEADLVLVHEWNDPGLVADLGACRKAGGRFKLLFHDTHHRAATAPEQMSRYNLEDYDGVLAFGEVIRDIYLDRGWTHRAWTWHEAADTRVFHPTPSVDVQQDMVWIGNWGDGERSEELHEFLLSPARHLGLTGSIYGVRYPEDARRAISHAGLTYRGWVPNHLVPMTFARHKVTVHVPRRPYVSALPGIPTIRVFEALACGIPLASSPWDDAEGLFRPGRDYVMARSGTEMRDHLSAITKEPEVAESLSSCGLETVLARHTCAHRVDELMSICTQLGADVAAPVATASSAR